MDKNEDIKKYNDFLNEEIDYAKAKSEYQTGKAKIDQLFNNKQLIRDAEKLDEEFDKIVNNMEYNKDMLSFYFSYKKLQSKKIILEEDVKEVMIQIKDKETELKDLESKLSN